MDFKKIGKALLFPHIAIMLVLLPVATVFLVYSMVFLGVNSIISIASYVLAFYTLTVWCLRVPQIIEFFKAFKLNNKYIRLWRENESFKLNVSLYGTLIWNTAYAVFQLGLGFWHHTFWFYSLAGYYISLAVMRFFLVRHTRKHGLGKQMLAEFKRYRACGIIFLIMNLALSLIIFFMVYWNRTFIHHEITTIALAAYTFTSMTFAIINIIKNRKSKSPVYSASRAISLAAACVSMLTLEATMLTTFGDDMSAFDRKMFLGLTGGVISVFIVVMAIYMIINATKKIKILKEKSNGK